MHPIISISNLSKTYNSGFDALKNINLDINRGEIFSLLGRNGAGKTTLISCICGIAKPSTGNIFIDGLDSTTDYRVIRGMIGLVPQEFPISGLDTVWSTVSFSRGLFGCKRNPEYIEFILKSLSLWDKKDSKLLALSGGMKRRVLIAKALAHEPKILFLDEPTSGVDIELRREMWNLIHSLKESGVTIILTTHYINEAEEMADRIGIIRQGEIVCVEEKSKLMHSLGKKQLLLQLSEQCKTIPDNIINHKLDLENNGWTIVYNYNTDNDHSDVVSLLNNLERSGIKFKDINTKQSSLEDIFLDIVGHKP